MSDHDEKGKELYAKLISADKQTNEPIKSFSDNMQILMNETEIHKKEGNKLSLAMLQFIDEAKGAREIVNDCIAEDGTITLTTETYAEANTKVSKALEELKELPKDSEVLEKEGFSSAALTMAIERFAENEEILIDAVKNIQDEYSTLINAYN